MLKSLAKDILKRTPYRVIRERDLNRFSAIDACLASLARRGYMPRRIIDGGANVGDFARLAARQFPDATIHLVEPQPACRAALATLAQSRRFVFHPVALSAAPGELVLSVDPGGVTTGAHVVPGPDASSAPDRVRVPAMSLDAMLGDGLRREDRTLLKLDLQGWELQALEGAAASLDRIEAILTEVSFFAQAFEPSIAAIVRFADQHGFALHDVAALAGRARDNRAHQADLLFVRRDSPLCADTAWQ